ncbi:PLP-dependent transferase [Conidiobolus coronatus NRRL 28638]|uniref:PLP-dependent transferase n=1 Tax=Conidiobolus coronatus (strain ATCC 28846 / CBS 209.66 / NRRL 28638) TaxID=796925 RepID=A0A137NYE5_CONC2|nr:PLP-dependent transferase [Conidiobolus coronatus NRRL 28638]|eukprot:KXN67691.1 PLP-dependent transferase [Conidiobolus coronatus NRRL 28638]
MKHMKDIINEKMLNYFKLRTPNGGGVVKDILARPPMEEYSINVGDNDYLCIASSVNMSTSSSDEIVFSNVFALEGAQCNLEERFSKFLKQEASLITQSGYAANTGIMQSICDKSTHLYVDRLLHSSFRDGIALKKAKAHGFKHNDLDDLEAKIQKFGPGIIMVEGLYSLDGDHAPLRDIIALKKKYSCILLVDESHSLGVFGPNGMGYSGTLEEYSEIDIYTASLAKCFGSRAGIIAGSQLLIDFVKETSFHNIFSSAVMNYDIIRIDKILTKISEMDAERAYLLTISKLLHDAIPKKFLKSKTGDITPIVSIVFDNEKDLVDMNQWLHTKQIFPACFIAPATDRPAIRFTLNCRITVDQLSICQDLSY